MGKWMQAGVMEEGVVTYPERGSPQGGVISPLTSNIYPGQSHQIIKMFL
jgi:retron-type reverse transcriptase